ncbi:MAG: AAA family ATPase [Thermoplasmata archaeon]
MSKRPSDGTELQPSKKPRVGESFYYKKVVVVGGDDPHVHVDIESEYVHVGNYIYKVARNVDWVQQPELANKIVVNMAQYEDIKKYIIGDGIMIKSFNGEFNKISNIMIHLENPNSFRAIINRNKLVSYIISLLTSHVVSIDQRFILNFENIRLFATIDKMQSHKMGVVTFQTNIDFDYSDYNIVVYDNCRRINAKFVKLYVTKCIRIFSRLAEKDVDNCITSHNKKFPIFVDKVTINNYVRDILDTFSNNDNVTCVFRNYELTFNIRVANASEQSRYKNIYQLTRHDHSLMDVTSNISNVIVKDGIKNATKISFCCLEKYGQKYSAEDYIIVVDHLIRYIRCNIKMVTSEQVFQYRIGTGKKINLKVNFIKPNEKSNFMYRIISTGQKEVQTKIVFDLERKSKFIYVGNPDPYEAERITFKIKRVQGSFKLGENNRIHLLDFKKMEKMVRSFFPKKTAVKHRISLMYEGYEYLVITKNIVFKSQISLEGRYATLGLITDNTEINFEISRKEKKLTIINQINHSSHPEIELEKYVGGLSNKVKKLVRSLCLSRGKLRNEFNVRGLKPIKGIIFYGPPGNGKTSLARNLGKIFGCEGERFRLMTGPEVFNKWLGQSEENVRNIFKPAKEAWRRYGDQSPLYMVVIDEIDAILGKRFGSDHSQARDSVVNQFLGELDGLEEFNNIICIGLTNRLELLDEAALRPGRFTVHIKISFPDREGRIEIFNIHTQKLKESKYMEDNIDVGKLADLMEGFSGADVESVIQMASLYSLERINQIENKQEFTESQNIVKMNDFISAIEEIKKMHKKDDKTFLSMYL